MKIISQTHILLEGNWVEKNEIKVYKANQEFQPIVTPVGENVLVLELKDTYKNVIKGASLITNECTHIHENGESAIIQVEQIQHKYCTICQEIVHD